jgi:probable phosphoglycerate mutase
MSSSPVNTPTSTGESARWPSALFLVRHAESVGNVARETAMARGEHLIDIAERDMDVALSSRGELQAEALGTWLGRLGDSRPTVVVASPYLRAARTAELAVSVGGLDLSVRHDERLREREFGVLDRLTREGIEARFPAEAEARARVGKFYYRPPSGESWCDVALRVRSAIDSISREHPGARVLVVTHEVVIYLFRYVLEQLSERQVLALGTDRPLANCSVTQYVLHDDGGEQHLRLDGFDDVGALEAHDAPVTHESDVPVAPR